MRIVLLESEKLIIQNLLERCAKSGVVLETFADIEAAFSAVKKDPDSVEAVFISLEMPGNDKAGFDLCKKLRLDQKTSEVPFVIMSSKLSNADFIKHQQSADGANAYLKKPVTVAVLVSTYEAVTGLKFPVEKKVSTKKAAPKPAPMGINVSLVETWKVLRPVSLTSDLAVRFFPDEEGEVKIPLPTEGLMMDEDAGAEALSLPPDFPPAAPDAEAFSAIEAPSVDVPAAEAPVVEVAPAEAVIEAAPVEAAVEIAPEVAPAPEAAVASVAAEVESPVAAVSQVPVAEAPSSVEIALDVAAPAVAVEAVVETVAPVAAPVTAPVAESVAAPAAAAATTEALAENEIAISLDSEGLELQTTDRSVPVPAQQVEPEEEMDLSKPSSFDANATVKPLEPEQIHEEDINAAIEKDLPYLFGSGGAAGGVQNTKLYSEKVASTASMFNPNLLSDLNQSGGGSAEVETLKKYLMVREQDIAILSAQLTYAKEELSKSEQAIKSLSGQVEDLVHKLDDRNIRTEYLEKELAHAGKNKDDEIDVLKIEIKNKGDRIKFLEDQLSEQSQQYERLRERVRQDIRKIRARERELENRLEIVKRDHETLIAARESKILELKRKIDLLEFNYDTLQDQNETEKSNVASAHEKIAKVVQVLKLAMGVIEGETSSDGRKLDESVFKTAS